MAGVFKRNKKIITAVSIGIVAIVVGGVYLRGLLDTTPSNPTLLKAEGLNLEIPAGAIPAHTSSEKVSIRLLQKKEYPAFALGIGFDTVYQLEPDGLELLYPAQFSITVPVQSGETPRIFHISKSLPSELELKVTFDPEHKTATITGEIPHFSLLGILLRLDREVDSKKLGSKYIKECTGIIRKMESLCGEFENWSLDVMVSRKDFSSGEKALRNDLDIDEIIEGSANRCPYNSEGENRYVSEFDISNKSDSTSGENAEVVCAVTCINWMCPARDEDVFHSPTPSSPPPLIQSCSFDSYIICRDKFNLQGCIDACPYVPATCSPGAPPNTDCTETDQACVDQCLAIANPHAAKCAADNNCTLNEIDKKLREQYPEQPQ